MSREYTRDELILDVAAASANLREVSSNGDVRRFTDERVFSLSLGFLAAAG
ncbi:MAG: hypothetical protein ACH36H_06085 [Candidatus Nanopelagicales bacterium]